MITTQLNTLRQSSARHWRIGQDQECRTVFMYYKGTAQDQAVKHMAAKLMAAEYLEGNLEAVGLAADAADDSLEMSIVRSLEST